MTSRPWRGIFVTRGANSLLLLQWSHDLAAMERQGTAVTSVGSQLLQWSHDLAAMESSAAESLIGHQLAGFNGAMTSRPWRVGMQPRI